MEKIRFTDKNDIGDDSISIEELKDKILELSDKIDGLANQLKSVENKIDRLQSIELAKTYNKDEVEIEERNELEEDYLTPPDILFETEALQNTGMKLIKLRIATASQIANITKRERAVESLYLNDLWNRNKVRKLRIGRAVYFYIGRPNEIKPFKNPLIKSDWRDPLISIFRNGRTSLDSGEVNFLNLSDLVKDYFDITQSERRKTVNFNEQAQKKIKNHLKEIFEIISTVTTFLKFDVENEIIEFIVDEWVKLA